MKVLHVITGLACGGAETQLELLLRHVRHKHEVVTLYNFGHVGQQMVDRGVNVYDLGMRSNRQVLSIFRLARLMRRGAYDVVHVHLYRACVYGRVAARMAGAPVVVTTEHSLGDTQIEGRKKTRTIKSLYLATDRLSDATVAVSPRVRERLIDWGVPERKIRVIPNGVDFDRYAFDPRAREITRRAFGIPSEDFVVGSVGRLHPFKRYDVLLRAAGPLLKCGGWLLLVGEGQERSRLQKLARENGYPQRVVFAGEREDIPQLLSSMDLFAATSSEETFGLAVLEAVAVGIRAVVAACPALDGVQLSGVRRVSEDPLELQRVLLEEYERAPRLAVTDEFVRRRYDVRAVATSLDELYESLLTGQGRSTGP